MSKATPENRKRCRTRKNGEPGGKGSKWDNKSDFGKWMGKQNGLYK